MPIFVGPYNSAVDIAEFNRMMTYLENSPPVPIELGDFWANQKVEINYNNKMQYDPVTDTISVDPYSALVVRAPDGSVGVQSPALGLYHEILHKMMMALATILTVPQMEEMVTTRETFLAKLLGEPIRANYGATGGTIKVSDPTQHTNPKVYWQVVTEDGRTITGPQYDGSDTSPDLGDGESSGHGGSGEGSGGSSGGGGGGGAMPGDNDPMPPDPDPSHWQNPSKVLPDSLILAFDNRSPDNQQKLEQALQYNEEIDTVDIQIVGVPLEQSAIVLLA